MKKQLKRIPQTVIEEVKHVELNKKCNALFFYRKYVVLFYTQNSFKDFIYKECNHFEKENFSAELSFIMLKVTILNDNKSNLLI